MMALATIQPMARIGATVLADSVAVGTAVALLVASVTLFFRRRSAATRFAVLMTGLVATAFLPLVRLGLNAGSTGRSTSLLQFGDSWAPWVLGIWAAIATAGLARVGFGVWSLGRLRRTCRVLDLADLKPEIAEALATYCPSRKVELLISREATVPAAIGFFHPAVVVPAWLLEEMTAEEVRHVAIHELSHLRRRDDWTNLLQQIVKALFFFHPAVWWMESRVSLEREMACDDSVLQRSHNPRAYAECLARIAERSFLRRGLAMAQAAVSRVRQTSQRVARILQIEKSLNVTNSKLSVGFAMVLTVAGAGAVWHTPMVFSFSNSPAATVAANSTPELVAPAFNPINAAWHEPVVQKAALKPAVRPVVRPTVVKKQAVPENRPVMVRTSFADDGQTVTRFVVVVVQDGDQVAVWRITTWQYSPSQQVRSAHKTT
jgi:beta-lactamase regulating signal transducer with metallopeptidase domain